MGFWRNLPYRDHWPKFDPTPDSIWTTRDGRKIRVMDMTDNHIRNVIAFLRKKSLTIIRLEILLITPMVKYAATAPDGAAMTAEHDADDISRKVDKILDRWEKWIKIFEAELRRRCPSEEEETRPHRQD